MADGGNDRDGGSVDGAGDDFLIKRPKILEAAAAAAEDEKIAEGVLVGLADLPDNFGGGLGSLNAGGEEADGAIPVAALEDGEKVPEGGTAGGGDDADGAGQGRDGLFAPGIEETLGFEAVFEFEEGLLEAAHAILLDLTEDNLVGAAGLVDAEASAADDLEAISELNGQAGGIGAKADAGDGGLAIPEREIDVPGRLSAQVTDFPADGNGGEIALEPLFDEAGEFGDGKGIIRLGVRYHGAGIVGESGGGGLGRRDHRRQGGLWRGRR